VFEGAIRQFLDVLIYSESSEYIWKGFPYSLNRLRRNITPTSIPTIGEIVWKIAEINGNKCGVIEIAKINISKQPRQLLVSRISSQSINVAC
jgi:hypothetical protein